MKTIFKKQITLLSTSATLATILILTIGSGNKPDSTAVEKAVLARLGEIQTAAEQLDAARVFSYVLENDKGALVQNGKIFQTRSEALESTSLGFQSLRKIQYRFDQQTVNLLAPTVALAVGQGTSSITAADGRSFNTPFVQSVMLVLTNGEWKVVHAHRSTGANK